MVSKNNSVPALSRSNGSLRGTDPVVNRTLFLLSFCLIAITGIITRLSLMTLSLWMDEAWVSNSVLAPSLREMFYYPRWLQSSPPLFLLLLRVSTVLGRSEMILRLVPWLAGALSAVLMGIILTRLFPPALAILGTLSFVTNYWFVKYSQQVKQYTADLLVAAIFLFLLLLYLENGRTRRLFWALVLAGAIGISLSYAAIFWFPVAILAVFVCPRRELNLSAGKTEAGKIENESFRARIFPLLIALLAYLGSLALVYVFFIRPNHSPNLVDFWKNDFIGSGGLAHSFVRFLVTFCDLMTPQQFKWSRLLSFAMGIIVLAGLIRAGLASFRGDRRAQNLLFVTTVPVAVALFVSFIRQYPLLTYPRMLIWMLPLGTVQLVYGAEPVWKLLTAKMSPSNAFALATGITLLVCVFAVYFNLFVVSRSNGQDARSAILYLKDHVGHEDPIFVRGSTVEQMIYYDDRLGWHPERLYVGDTNLPCCLRTFQVVSPSLADQGFAEDIHTFASSSTGRRAWFFMDRVAYQTMKDTIHNAMSSAGCQTAKQTDFEGLSLFRFDCMTSPQALP
jgi:uncharacterized membrane protein